MSISLYTDPAQLTPGKFIVEHPHRSRAICGHRGRVISVSRATALIAPGWNETPIDPNYAGQGVRSTLASIRFVCDTEAEAFAIQGASAALKNTLDLEAATLEAAHAALQRAEINRLVTP